MLQRCWLLASMWLRFEGGGIAGLLGAFEQVGWAWAWAFGVGVGAGESVVWIADG
jgi:hypothetical protein